LITNRFILENDLHEFINTPDRYVIVISARELSEYTFSPETIFFEKPDQYPCGACSNNCQDNSIQCDDCLSWFHFQCLNLSQEQIEYYLENSQESWFCYNCEKLKMDTDN